MEYFNKKHKEIVNLLLEKNLQTLALQFKKLSTDEQTIFFKGLKVAFNDFKLKSNKILSMLPSVKVLSSHNNKLIIQIPNLLYYQHIIEDIQKYSLDDYQKTNNKNSSKWYCNIIHNSKKSFEVAINQLDSTQGDNVYLNDAIILLAFNDAFTQRAESLLRFLNEEYSFNDFKNSWSFLKETCYKKEVENDIYNSFLSSLKHEQKSLLEKNPKNSDIFKLNELISKIESKFESEDLYYEDDEYDISYFKDFGD